MKSHKLLFHLSMLSTAICVFGYFISKQTTVKNLDNYFLFFVVFNLFSAIQQYYLWTKKSDKDKKNLQISINKLVQRINQDLIY